MKAIGWLAGWSKQKGGRKALPLVLREKELLRKEDGNSENRIKKKLELKK